MRTLDTAKIRNRTSAGVNIRRYLYITLAGQKNTSIFTSQRFCRHQTWPPRDLDPDLPPLTPVEWPSPTAAKTVRGAAPRPESQPIRPHLHAEIVNEADPRDEDMMIDIENQAAGSDGRKSRDMTIMIGRDGVRVGW